MEATMSFKKKLVILLKQNSFLITQGGDIEILLSRTRSYVIKILFIFSKDP